MRQAFVRALCEEARQNKKVFLITGDLGFRILEPFAEEFPDRFLNIGVAEANMVTVAAGLASTGYIPFVYSIATFASMRPFEQIRNDVCLQNLNVKIVGIGGGLAYTKAGPTHHSMEDIGLMRLLPNMTIIAPQDPHQAYAATHAIIKQQGPTYFRLERNPSAAVKKTLFKFGKGIVIEEGAEIALLATGVQVYTAIEVATQLKKNGVKAGVYAFPTIQPMDKKLLETLSRKYKLLVSIEEHRIDGGFGSCIAEFISSSKNKPHLFRFGFGNSFTSVSTDYPSMIEYHGLSSKQIVSNILQYSTIK
jgi:transketolase